MRLQNLFWSFVLLGSVAAFQSTKLGQHGPRSTIVLHASTVAETKKSRWGWLRNKLRRKEVASANFDGILQSRRTINSFETELPGDWESKLETAIQSAVYAPNHKRTEPWRFHLLGKEAIQKVCELNSSIVTEKKGEKAGQKKLERWLLMPGWLVATCKTASDSGESMEKPASLEREDYAACCCAVQNLCLSLHNSGMGTKWTTGPVNFDPRFSDIVGLEKNEYVVGTIWFGTPEALPEAPNKKLRIDDVFIKHS